MVQGGCALLPGQHECCSVGGVSCSAAGHQGHAHSSAGCPGLAETKRNKNHETLTVPAIGLGRHRIWRHCDCRNARSFPHLARRTPYPDAVRLTKLFPLITVRGGKEAKSGDCEELSAHGYYGRETETVAAPKQWRLGKPYPTIIGRAD
jgi:hypothetical protein